MHNHVYSLSVELKLYDSNISYLCAHISDLSDRMFEIAREWTLTKRNLACSMIMISENATPITLLQGNGSLVQLCKSKNTMIFIPKNNSDLQHQHDHCKCQSIAK